MNAWIGMVIALGIPLILYLYLRKRMNTPKAGLTVITTYILLGLVLIALGWDVSPLVIVLPGLFAAFLDVLQLRQHP